MSTKTKRQSVIAMLATIVLAGPALGTNLIANGDFEAGNTGFDSEYNHRASGTMYYPAEYRVATNPHDCHYVWADFGDHTSGAGNMLVINASCDDRTPTPGIEVFWEQTLEVIPGVEYVFTYWLKNSHDLYPENIASVETCINGTAIGTASAPVLIGDNGWERVSYTWQADEAVVTIQLKDLTRKYYGDDFVIDDISLCARTVTVDIDIKPGGNPNSFNINGSGVIPVAILGSVDFDVHDIDPATVSLAGLAVAVRGKDKLMVAYEDVIGPEDGPPDGYIDLVIKFEDDAGMWVVGDDVADLIGNLYDGTPIYGWDYINVVP